MRRYAMACCLYGTVVEQMLKAFPKAAQYTPTETSTNSQHLSFPLSAKLSHALFLPGNFFVGDYDNSTAPRFFFIKTLPKSA